MRILRVLVSLIIVVPALHSVTAGSPYTTRGVAADGRVVIAPPNAHRPWGPDLVTHPKPPTPTSLRGKHFAGEALCRITFDVHSGAVTDVAIVKSSGYRDLDASIARTVRQQWKVRPNTWREFEIYIGISSLGSSPTPKT